MLIAPPRQVDEDRRERVELVVLVSHQVRVNPVFAKDCEPRKDVVQLVDAAFVKARQDVSPRRLGTLGAEVLGAASENVFVVDVIEREHYLFPILGAFERRRFAPTYQPNIEPLPVREPLAGRGEFVENFGPIFASENVVV